LIKDVDNLHVGRRRVTLKDIARELNLSHATVSRALNRVEDAIISEATRVRVRAVADQMGYRPNHAGRSLATGKTGLMCLWLWTEGRQTSYPALVSQLIQSEAQRRSYHVLVNPSRPEAIRTPSKHGFDPWNVDGVIAHESAPAIVAHLGRATRPPVPIVTTGTYHLLPGVDCVQIDVAEGAREAVRHLIQAGRRRILYVTENPERQAADQRHIAYCELISDAGLEPLFADMSSDRALVRAGIRQWVERHGMPDALYCHNDDMAIGAYRGLCDLGVRVPDDVAIVGCNGIEDTEYLEVPISTIALPLAEMSAIACKFLETRIEDPAHPIQEARLEAHLSVRQSSGAPFDFESTSSVTAQMPCAPPSPNEEV
jgi:LacI family transcriptional regulator